MKIFITGGAGFIGSALIRYIIKNTNDSVVNIDNLTYSGDLESLRHLEASNRYNFEKVDVCDQESLTSLFENHKPQAVMHLAAESHVDRSIISPDNFIKTNIFGAYSILEASRAFYNSLSNSKKDTFRFHHISTDEVYGDLGTKEELFTEITPYNPSSPYSASKASADHLVRSWHRTYKLPIIITNCSNNYGPYQFPEKLIPLTIINALNGREIPIYGDGMQVRDWLYVEDHARALYEVVSKGKVGETYNIGSRSEKTNLEVVETICDLLNDLISQKSKTHSHYKSLIKFISDRPGHDLRYAVDPQKIESELDWRPKETFSSGMHKTVKWYLDNQKWYSRIIDSTPIN